MMWWSGVLVVAFGLVALGWGGHLWYCMRRNGCPIYRQLDTGEWVNKLSMEGWLTRNGKRHYPRNDAENHVDRSSHNERHPITEVVTPKVLAEALGKNQGLDEANKLGVPSERMETPVTGVANPKRRTTP